MIYPEYQNSAYHDRAVRAAKSGAIRQLEELFTLCDYTFNFTTAKDGCSPLLSAVNGGQHKTMDFLWNSGTDTGITHPRLGNRTILHEVVKNNPTATEENVYTVLRIIVNGKEIINNIDDIGNTPLHYAVQASEKFNSIIELLIGFGADVHATDATGRTAFELASTEIQQEISDFLALTDKERFDRLFKIKGVKAV